MALISHILGIFMMLLLTMKNGVVGTENFYLKLAILSKIKENVSAITLANISMPTIPKAAFDKLSESKTLVFINTKTLQIERDAWLGLNNLESLSIEESSLTALNTDIFYHLKSLIRLKVTSIRNNDLRYFPTDRVPLKPGAFSGLHSLNSLWLSLPNLNEITIKTTDHSIWQDIADTLTELMLPTNDFTGLFENIFIQFGKLEKLSFQDNRITTVSSKAFHGLELLREIDLSQNKINELDHKTFQALAFLSEINLAKNRIEFLAVDLFKGLKQLRILKLDNNLLKTMGCNVFDPTDFFSTGGHPEILELRLHGNPVVWNNQTYWMEVGRNQGWLSLDVDPKCDHQFETDTMLQWLKCIDINECEPNLHKCSLNSECENSIGSYTCKYKPGYNGDGIKCNDMNECSDGSHQCSIHGTCYNTEGSYACMCNTGYIGNGFKCRKSSRKRAKRSCPYNYSSCGYAGICINFECHCHNGYRAQGSECIDIDECSGTSHLCSPDATCTNTVGSHTCICNSGYTGDGRNCDWDECNDASHDCSPHATCINTIGSYICNCNSGFVGDGKDCDLDECSGPSHSCSPDATCTNTVGSYTCTCNSGYIGDGRYCDWNECNDGSSPCSPYATCTNTVGSYTCTCNSGYIGDGRNCNWDECNNGSHQCSPFALCTNTIGSYSCSCIDGFTGNGTVCIDINECTNGSHLCSPDSTCINTLGTYNCSCNTGFIGDGQNCIDINECIDRSHSCSNNATCTNTAGSYTCSCNENFFGDGFTCTRLNPCHDLLNQCDRNAKCFDSGDTFHCQCLPGYTGDGQVCSDINECDNDSNNCSDNASCLNIPGSYNCTCDSGFEGDGLSCIDINECLTGVHSCAPEADCTNTNGSYLCACATGFKGNGLSCDDINECEDLSVSCPKNSVCVNTIGTYLCQCKEGFTQNGNSCQKTECHAGQYTPNGTTCQECPMNTYNSVMDNSLSECSPCPPHHTTTVSGASSITQCRGFFIDGTTGEPKQCKEGTYQSHSSQSSCVKCPANRPRTGGPGATSEDQCVSPEHSSTSTSLTLDELFTEDLYDKTSLVFAIKFRSITTTIQDGIGQLRYFEGVTVNSFSLSRSRGIIVHLQVSMLSHPQAECLFMSRIHNLNSLFPGGSFGRNTCTQMTILGENLDLNGRFEVLVGTLRCPITNMNEFRTVCMTQPLADEFPSDTEQPVKIFWMEANMPEEVTRFTFSYKQDPTVYSIHPDVTIPSGGVPITVTGNNVDSVEEPIMVVTIITNAELSVYYQTCQILSSTQFMCPTPNLLTEYDTAHQKRRTEENQECEFVMKYHDLEDNIQGHRKEINPENTKVYVEFIMDGAGVKPGDDKTFQLKVVVDPVITDDTEDTQLYVNHLPCTGGVINIKGENFLDELTPDLYTVTVGDEKCKDVTVTDNSISCLPPRTEPRELHVRVMITIGTGCLRRRAYKLKHCGPLDCKQVQYIMGSCLGGGLLGAVIIAVCYKKRRKFRLSPLGSPDVSHTLKNRSQLCRSNNYDLSPTNKNSMEEEYMDPISHYLDVMEPSGRSTSRPGYLEMESSVLSALSRVRAGHHDKSSNYYHVPRKISRLEDERSRPPLPSLSGRLNLELKTRLNTEKQYPDIGRMSSARKKRISDWFPSGETGPKLYGRFTKP